MKTSTEMIHLPVDGFGLEPAWETQRDLIRRTVAVGASEDELKLFLYTAKRAGLDPLARQIYYIRRGGRGTVQVSIDGLRLIADRTGRYAGADAPEFLGETPEGFPMIARVTVYKMVGGVRCPFSATARWDEYYPGEAGGAMWRRMAHTMLGKCAEALALRRAFPADLSGLYVHEEMAQADPNLFPETPTPEPAPSEPATPEPRTPEPSTPEPAVPEEPRRHGPGVTPETPAPDEPGTHPTPFPPGPSPSPMPGPGPAPVGDPPMTGPSAFGYRPAKWPSARMMGEAATENQFRMLEQKARVRRLTPRELATLRAEVGHAYGLEEDASKGALSLMIDFLIAASDQQLNAARGKAQAA